MAESRSNMVTLLNVSTPYSESEKAEYARVCPTEDLTISYEADTSEVRYICDDTSTTTILGRTLSFDLEMQYEKENRVIIFMNRMFLNPPVGSAANRDFINFMKSDIVPGSQEQNKAVYFGFKQPCTYVATSLGGSSTDPLGIGANISGRGDSIPGYITVEQTGDFVAYSFEPATTQPPVIEVPAYGASSVSLTADITGTGINGAEVQLYTDSSTLGDAITVDTNGTWKFTPETDDLKANTTYNIIATQSVTSGTTTVKSVPTVRTTFKTAGA